MDEMDEPIVDEAGLPARAGDARAERCTASVRMSALLSAVTAGGLIILLWTLFG